MVFEFGRNGFFGYSAISPTQAMWWSTCQADDVPNERRMNPEELKAQLIARHGSWKDPHVHSLVEKSNVDSIYPVWQTPQLPHWGEHGLVVLGDAAHAISPTSGQGSSQAFEDAKCFTMVLSKFLAVESAAEEPNKVTEQEAIDMSIKTFYAVRSPRVKKIYERTKMMAGRKRDQTLPEEMILCLILWLMGKIPRVGKMLLGDVNKELYEWDMKGVVDEAVKKALKS
jgi:2-polyprenyl-6-methoxyphenol hydroxylase-like FAD-dependent oxidoreductase